MVGEVRLREVDGNIKKEEGINGNGLLRVPENSTSESLRIRV